MPLTLNHLRYWDGTSSDYQSGSLIIADQSIDGISTDPYADGIDCSGLTAIPGLIDAHVHMVLDPEIRNPFDQLTDAEKLRPEMEQRASRMVDHGITTARDLGGGQWLEFELRDRIATGEVPGPRLVCAGQPITSMSGHCHFWGGEAEQEDSVLEVLERQVSRGADLIKVMATGGNITPGSKPIDAQFDEQILRAIVGRASSHGLHVAAHCHGVDGIRNAANTGVKTIEHCSWVGKEGWGLSYSDEIAQSIVENDSWVSPTINAGWKRFQSNQKMVERIQSNYKKMRNCGVRLIASTDAGIPNVFHHDLPKALPVFQFFANLTPLETLRAATSDCAQAIGLGETTGRIALGYAADIVIVEGDPLVDLAALQNPVAIIAQGRTVKAL
jgi:imidazolonepropionase-like amidohydrolase